MFGMNAEGKMRASFDHFIIQSLNFDWSLIIEPWKFAQNPNLANTWPTTRAHHGQVKPSPLSQVRAHQLAQPRAHTMSTFHAQLPSPQTRKILGDFRT